MQGSPSKVASIGQILGKFSAADKHWISTILEQLLSAVAVSMLQWQK